MTKDTYVVTWKRTPTGWQAEQQRVTRLSDSGGPFVMYVYGDVEKLREELSPERVYEAASAALSKLADEQARETYASPVNIRGCAHASLFAANCPRCMWGDR